MSHSFMKSIMYWCGLVCLCSSLLIACSSDPTSGRASGTPQAHTPTPTPTPPISTPTTAATPTPITQPVPPTQTDCPARLTGRALVTAPLAQGKDPQIIYALTKQRITRYDTVTHTSTDIVTLPATKELGDFGSGLFARNDQWVFFFTREANSIDYVSGDLQAVRIDGQGLQTLECAMYINFPLISPDHHYIAFNDFEQMSTPSGLFLFDTTTGVITPHA